MFLKHKKKDKFSEIHSPLIISQKPYAFVSLVPTSKCNITIQSFDQLMGPFFNPEFRTCLWEMGLQSCLVKRASTYPLSSTPKPLWMFNKFLNFFLFPDVQSSLMLNKIHAGASLTYGAIGREWGQGVWLNICIFLHIYILNMERFSNYN